MIINVFMLFFSPYDDDDDDDKILFKGGGGGIPASPRAPRNRFSSLKKSLRCKINPQNHCFANFVNLNFEWLVFLSQISLSA